MATDYDTRPRDHRAPIDPLAADPYATGAPGSPAGLGTPTRGHPVDPAPPGGSRNTYLIVGALVVAAIVLFLIFSGTGGNQTAPTTTAPAIEGTAPGIGADTGAAPGFGEAPAAGGAPVGGEAAPVEGTAPAGDAPPPTAN